jgi:hypothetical protein
MKKVQYKNQWRDLLDKPMKRRVPWNSGWLSAYQKGPSATKFAAWLGVTKFDITSKINKKTGVLVKLLSNKTPDWQLHRKILHLKVTKCG